MNNIIASLAIIIHMGVKFISEYLDFKHRHGYRRDSASTHCGNLAVSFNSENTVSLKSSLLFGLVLVTGLLVKSGSRNMKLLYFIPLQITVMAVGFPLAIIVWNPKLKLEFSHFLQRHLPPTFKCFFSKRIYPII